MCKATTIAKEYKMKALKLVYIADRYHLRKYGRLITNDTYFAMNYGPVPSGTKDIAEASEVFLDRSLYFPWIYNFIQYNAYA